MAKILNTYTGEGLKERTEIKDDQGHPLRTLDVYIPDDDLVDAVNLAIQLDRPLLLMGEPGCGKTRLAEAVAYELHGDQMNEHFFRWDIKSTTKAKEGIYQYDALKRLYHANLKTEDAKYVEDISNYITKGKLAEALTEGDEKYKVPNILLIDEIDKADIDFPNDLLLELENKSFKIPELKEDGEFKATREVVIFITSNQEKELPPAFLRRCLFHYIEFPDQEKLQQIVKSHFASEDEEIVNQALTIFSEIRDSLGEADKKPSTSELIDWFKMIDFYSRLKAEKPDAKDRNPTENRLITQLDQLTEGKIPFAQALLKTLPSKQKIEQSYEWYHRFAPLWFF